MILRLFLLVFFSGIGLSCSNQNMTPEPDLDKYFGRLEISAAADIHLKEYFNNKLDELGEIHLSDTSVNRITYRLIVDSSIGNAYCIRVEKDMDKFAVIYKVLPDRQSSIRFGVDNLRMTYETRSPEMDSIYYIFKATLEDSRYHNWDNLYDLRGGNDGTYYLFEVMAGGNHKVIFRWDIGFERLYKDSDDFLKILRAMHSFVPDCLLQNSKLAKTPGDFRFDIFRQ